MVERPDGLTVERIADMVARSRCFSRPILATLLAGYAHDHGVSDDTVALARRVGLTERQVHRLAFRHLPRPGESLWVYILKLSKELDAPVDKLADLLEDRGYLILDHEYRSVSLTLPNAIYLELERSARARKRTIDAHITDMLSQIVALMMHDRQDEKPVMFYKEK